MQIFSTARTNTNALYHGRTSAISALVLHGVLSILLLFSTALNADVFIQDDSSQGLVSIEAESSHFNVSQGQHQWQFIQPGGESGWGAMQASPNTGTNINSGYVTNSPRLDYQVEFSRTGKHYVWILGQGMSDYDDSVHAGLDGVAVNSSDRISSFNADWTWSNKVMGGSVATIDVPTTGTHTVNVWMREDGFTFDKLVLTTDPDYVPTGTGPLDSAYSSSRITAGLVSYYPFTEGRGNIVSDQSGNGAPMDLSFSGAVSWHGTENGVVLNGGRVGTTGAATKLIEALSRSNTSTFEAWVQPANLTQSGPARLISVSGGVNAENFMLGQVDDDVQARLLHTGKERRPFLTTGNGVLDTPLVHLVHTYDGAVERLYINGVQHSETLAIGGSYSNWDATDLFNIGNEASMNRPYAGIVRLVAVYDRALGDAEILQNYDAGPGTAVTEPDPVTGSSTSPDPDPAVNTAPVISGTPMGSVTVNAGYAFRPKVSDADGDSLRFSITNKPSWASFSRATGRLSGTPGAANTGSYKNIVISVSDGTDSASLPAFSIRVDAEQTPTQTGSFTLNWTAPATRADGTPLSLAEIGGFRIYYGGSSGNYTHEVDVADGTVQTATVSDVPAGTYHIVVTSYDTAGRKSGYSAEITETVQ